jgi:hypothetical protein
MAFQDAPAGPTARAGPKKIHHLNNPSQVASNQSKKKVASKLALPAARKIK